MLCNFGCHCNPTLSCLFPGLSVKGASATSTKGPRLSTERDAGNIVNENG